MPIRSPTLRPWSAAKVSPTTIAPWPSASALPDLTGSLKSAVKLGETADTPSLAVLPSGVVKSAGTNC